MGGKVKRGRRTLILTVVIIVALLLGAAGALQFAIARNGPAVLDTVDRIAGEADEIERLPLVRYGEHPAQKLTIHRFRYFEANETRPVLVFLHGGSWRSGDPEDYNFVGRNFASRGMIVVNAGYRLGEDGRWPAMMEDSAAAVAWVHENIADYGGDPDRVYLMGHSAGAYNVAMLALDRQWLEREGLGDDAVKGVIGLSGPYDFYPFARDSTRDAFGDAPQPEATQPINHVRGDAPPLLLIHGEQDTLVKPRNTRALANALEQAGGAVSARFYPGMDHNAPLLALAAPWLSRRDVAGTVSDFVLGGKASVPVQPQTR